VDHNIFGNLTGAPIASIEENRGDNFAKIFLYEDAGGYIYGYQAKIGKVIRQKSANIADERFHTREAARTAAEKEIEKLCSSANKNTRNLFADFNVIRRNQPELF
jgi:hypothetical protein